MLSEGFHKVPAGHIATTVTYLEMTAPPGPRAAPGDHDIRRVMAPEVAWYRDLFLRVGGMPWLWTSRMVMPDGELEAIIQAPGVEVYALFDGDRAVGLTELDLRDDGICELAFFGLAPEAIGTGAGRAMMNRAVTRAFEGGTRRLTVHTCTLDSPQALRFYRRSGFVPIRTEVEVFADPRLSGQMPREAGPNIPIIEAG